MGSNYEVYKNEFLKNVMYDREEIEYEQYGQLNQNDRLCEQIDGANHYYKLLLVKYSDEEVNQALQFKIYDTLEEMDKKQGTMKNIMIFWLALTIINLCSAIYIASKIGKAFSSLSSY